MMIKISTSTWWKVIAVAFFMIVTFNTIKPALSFFEGRFMPVFTDVKITEIVETPEMGFIDFSGTVNKARDCEIVGYRWFLTEPDGTRRQRFDVFIFNDRWRRYNLGPNEFGPRRAYVDANAFLSYAYGIAVHRCHALYDTDTTFYRGDKVK